MYMYYMYMYMYVHMYISINPNEVEQIPKATTAIWWSFWKTTMAFRLGGRWARPWFRHCKSGGKP